MITVTINEKKIELEKPVTILEAARANGIKIPTFCHHPVLEQWGGCRMCLVEIEKIPRLQTACTAMVADGMVVHTETPKVIEARKSVLEFLLINHPLECPVCDKAGECELQDLTVKYGAASGRFAEGKRKYPESTEDPIIVRNMDRCILCTRCVRMCDGVQGASAIEVVGRGNKSFIEPFSGGKYNCEYCGNCISVCPVGSVMSRLHRYSYRPWQMDRTVNTTCSFCGVGCRLTLQVRDESIKRVISKFGTGVNNGLLCNRGRFGYEYTSHPEKLKVPLIRENGKLREASWSEALDLTASKLSAIKASHGGEAIGAIASARCTNEENYLLQKIMRAGLGTNNIDSIARLGLLPAQSLLEEILGQGITANIMAGILNSDAVIVVAADPTRVNPILGLQVRAAAKAGKKVIVIGHAPGLKRHRTAHLPARFGTEGMVLAGLLGALLKDGKPLPGENKGLEESISTWELPDAARVEKASGVSSDAIKSVASELKNTATVSIIAGRDLAANSDIIANMHVLAALAYILNGRLFLSSERPNEQGLIEMGCAPDMLPGERPVEMETFRKKYEEAWGVKIPAKEGLTLMEMIEAADKGAIKAMYVLGENPAFNLPDSSFVQGALNKLDFLVVQDLFMTETAELADVILPALGWAEKDGTYINLEKRMQLVKKALFREGMEDWRILAELGSRLNVDASYNASHDIIKEFAALSPIHAGLSHEDLENGMLWPYKGTPLRQGGTKPAGIKASDFSTGTNGNLTAALDRPLFHSGTLSRHAAGLLAIQGEPYATLNVKTATGLGLEEGSLARISSDKGSVLLKIKLDDETPEGTVLLGNNFKKAGAMLLFGYELEPWSKIPVLKIRNLKVERVQI